MKFRKEILVFSLILIFMLMSAVSAEENMTIDDDAITSDYMALDSNQSYDVSDDSIADDSVIDDDKNISKEDSKADSSSEPTKTPDYIIKPGYNVISKASSAIAGASSSNDFAFHKSSSYPKYNSADTSNERSTDEKLSNFQSPDAMGLEALNDISSKDLSWQTVSSYSKYFDYIKLDSFKNMIDESEIGDVLNGNADIIDFKTIDYLKDNLIGFMDAGAKYADLSIGNLFDIDAFFDIFDKIMNMPTTHNTMTNIPSSNTTPTLRNHKDYPDYGFYPDADSIMNSYDLNDDEELIIESDSNITDMLIIHDNAELINQTSDLNAMHDIHIDSFEDMKPDLQISDAGDCRHDTYRNSDEIIETQCLKLSQQINCLSSNMSEDIQHSFYHVIGCECTNTNFTKQHASYDNLPEVSEFDTVTSTEKEDNRDDILFKKINVNAPFIVENSSVFALFGVIKITIP